MKQKVIKVFVGLLMLASAAIAADRSTGTFVQQATEGYYGFDDYSWGMSMDLRAIVFKSGGRKGASVYINLWDSMNMRSVDASGRVPASMLKTTQNRGITTLEVNIPDLRELVGPDFYLYEFGFFLDTLAVHCTMVQTPSWTEHVITQRTDRSGDGTVVKEGYNYMRTSMYAEGNVVGYTVPLNYSYYGYETRYLQTGNFRYHYLP